MNAVTPVAIEEPSRGVRISALTWICLGLVGVLITVLSIRLWPQWRHNPDLSHGLFMPIVFGWLVHEARTTGRQRFLPSTWPVFAAQFLTLGLSMTVLIASGLYAAALDWAHPLVGFTFAGAVTLLLLAALLTFSTRSMQLVSFNWNSLLAVGLWSLSAPIPPGTYGRLTLGLQLWVSENVLRALHLLGIPARAYGNIIELARTTVGIEEACSGVRSLISCVFVGLVFSGSVVRRPGSRALIIALTIPLALGMNFVRSLGLTLLAHKGVDISGRWHDVTGFAVLGVTALALGGLAVLLERREKRRVREPEPFTHLTPAISTAPTRRTWMLPILAGGLVAALAIAGFFTAHTEIVPEVVKTRTPDLAAILPESASEWRVLTATDLQRFRDKLQTDVFVQRTYIRETEGGPLQLTVYLAYWAPGQASASLVATHTPDGCWPGAGWESVPVASTRERIASRNRTLTEGEYRLFHNRSLPQHVWFWHLYNGRPIKYIDPLSPKNLLEIAARYGFRQPGEQMFIRISTNRPWSHVASEPLVAEIFSRLQSIGL